MTTTDEPSTDEVTRGPGRRRWPLRVAVAGGVAAAALVAVLVVAQGDDGDGGGGGEVAFALPSPLVMSSCAPFDESTLSAMSTAFAGTVSEITTTDVVIEVDRWFRPADESADVARLRLADPNTSASLDGVEFAAGRRYLVTAANGTVNGCGFTVVATPELESVFEQAFGA